MARAVAYETHYEDTFPVRSRISWGAIFAGALVAISVHLVLTVLGTAIGFTVSQETDARELGTGAAIYGALITLIALFLGGWITSLFAVGENKFEAGVHGLVMWGVFMGFLGFLLVGGANRLINMAMGAASTAPAQAASQELRDEARQAVPQGQAQPQAQQEQLRQRMEQAAAGADEAAEKAAPAAWWTFVGVLLSMVAAIGGALVGGGPTVRVREVRTATAVPPPPPPPLAR